MKSYIAIALVLCLAVMQVSSQAPAGAGGANKAMLAAHIAKSLSRGGGAGGRGGLGGFMMPYLLMGQGNDALTSLLMYQMISKGGKSGGMNPMLAMAMAGAEVF